MHGQSLVAPRTFGDLSDLENFVRTPRGWLLKGKLPILEASAGEDNRGMALRVSEAECDKIVLGNG